MGSSARIGEKVARAARKPSNESKACDAVLRFLENESGAGRTAPMKLAHGSGKAKHAQELRTHGPARAVVENPVHVKPTLNYHSTSTARLGRVKEA